MNLQQGDIVEARIPTNNHFAGDGYTKAKVLEVISQDEVLLRISAFGDTVIAPENKCHFVLHGYAYNKRPA
jgi:hypothetical protein